MSTINPVTLEEVNNHLLERLDALIDNAEGEALLKVTEAIAKLNTSRRNSDQFIKPDTEESRAEREAIDALTAVMKDN